LGAWWKEKTNLPLPLGGNSIKRDMDKRLGDGTTKKLTTLLLQSIEYAMANREKSLDWATQWGRGIDMECTDAFVEMYVNRWTLDFGDRGKQAVHTFLEEAAKVNAVPKIETVAFV
jgi:1,4-dihydroxy-6-naphthoate synthase